MHECGHELVAFAERANACTVLPPGWSVRRHDAHVAALLESPKHAEICDGAPVERCYLPGAQPMPCAFCDPVGWELWDIDPYTARPELHHGP